MKQFGSYLADTLAKDNQIPEEQQAVYAYLFDYLIESLLYDVIVLIIGMIFHHTGATVCYLLVTIPLRHFAGGFHANTRLGCTILSYGIFFLTVFPSSFLVSLIKPGYGSYFISCPGPSFSRSRRLTQRTNDCQQNKRKNCFIDV